MTRPARVGRYWAVPDSPLLAEKPKGKFGVHPYAPEDWGLTADGLRESLAPYIDHFGVELE